MQLATPESGWQVGDKLVLPDTRQPGYGGQSGTDWTAGTSEIEQVTIQSISANGLTVTLSAALQYSHTGATNAAGALEYLPQVVNMTRNITIHSQSATGTRGYALFTGRADVSINYTSFGGMGRTNHPASAGLLNDVAPLEQRPWLPAATSAHIGTNEENRDPVTFLDLFGPSTPQADGYQFTFVGNTVSCPLNPMPFIWGINVTNSYYGLIQNNDLDSPTGATLTSWSTNFPADVLQQQLRDEHHRRLDAG